MAAGAVLAVEIFAVVNSLWITLEGIDWLRRGAALGGNWTG
jgi:hypothetical protein